ncbi:MAG: VWA domain-containing protein [Planctomycetota bacterium]
MDLWFLSDPQRLWLLLVLPLLLWLARPHRPRHRVATPHLEQWLRARARLGRRPRRFPWLRWLLAAVAATATVGAFAGARYGGRSGPQALAVVVDASASMAARVTPEGEETAFASAVTAVREALAALPPHVRVRVVACSDSVTRLPSDAAMALEQLAQISPRGAGLVDLSAVGRELDGLAHEVAVWTVTDGLGPTPPAAVGALTLVGSTQDNAGITAVAIEDAWPLPEVQASLTVDNFSGRPGRWMVRARGGVEDAAAPVELRPGESARVGLALRRTRGGRLELWLDGTPDGFAVDDRITVQLPEPAAPRIAVLADDETSPGIAAAAAALAAETGGRVLAAAAAGEADYLITDGGILPGPAVHPRSLSFGTRRQDAPLSVADIEPAPTVADWDREDPITRGLDLSELQVQTCLVRDFGGAGATLIRAAHGPLAVLSRDPTSEPAAASVHVAFRLSDSNFALLPAFPQFVRRSFARSFGAGDGAVPGSDSLLSAAESDLRPPSTGRPAERPLPAFGAPSVPLAPGLLLLALAALALRVWV